MLAVYDSVERFFSRLNLWLAIAGAGVLFFAASIIFMEVVSRAVVGTSRLWVIEVSEYSLLYITCLGAPYLLEKNMHVTLDILYLSLARGWQTILRVINSLIGFAICVVLTFVGVDLLMDQIDTGVRVTSVMAPHRYWITFALPLGMFLMAVQFLFQGVGAIRRKGL